MKSDNELGEHLICFSGAWDDLPQHQVTHIILRVGSTEGAQEGTLSSNHDPKINGSQHLAAVLYGQCCCQ